MTRSRKAKEKEEAAAIEPRQALLSDLEAMPFNRLVRTLEARNPQAPRVGMRTGPAEEAIRFRASRSRSFEPAEIAEVKTLDEEGRTEVRVNFLGLYGPASPLPPEFTDRVIDNPQTPSATEDFLDLFNHRLISLDHLSWRKQRYDLRYEPGGRDPVSKRVLALGGFPVEIAPPGPFTPEEWLRLAGLVALGSRSAETLTAILSQAFEVPCRIREFVPREVVMEEASQLQLGRRNNSLGEDSVLGSRIEDDLGKFRICFGPASFEALKPIMPGGERHHDVIELAAIFAGALDWDISFEFEPHSLPEASLGAARLGAPFPIGGEGGGGAGNPVILCQIAAGSTEPNRSAEGQFSYLARAGTGGS